MQVDQVYKNYQLEDLLKQLLDAKKAESEKYYDQVANNAVGEDNGDIANKSPIEMVRLGQNHIVSLMLPNSIVANQTQLQSR